MNLAVEAAGATTIAAQGVSQTFVVAETLKDLGMGVCG